jgi:hypothetical protein
LDRKRIEELRKFAAQKQSAKQIGKLKSVTPGMLLFPPLVPETAPFENGSYPIMEPINPDNLHPHMIGILGIPIDEQVLKIMKEVTQVLRPPLIEMASKSANESTDCPRCLGMGFRHNSSSKHDKKLNERCKACITCKGISY